MPKGIWKLREDSVWSDFDSYVKNFEDRSETDGSVKDY